MKYGKKVVQLIFKLALIFEHSQLETKKGSIGSMLWLKRPWRLPDAPTCRKGILIIGCLRLNLHGQGGSKRERVDFKGSLTEAIIPSDGTHNLLHAYKETRHFHTRWLSPLYIHYLASWGFPNMVRLSHNSQLSTLKGNLKCSMSNVSASDEPMKLKTKKKKQTSHTSILKSSSRL